MDYTVHGVAKSWAWLNKFHFQISYFHTEGGKNLWIHMMDSHDLSVNFCSSNRRFSGRAWPSHMMLERKVNFREISWWTPGKKQTARSVNSTENCLCRAWVLQLLHLQGDDICQQPKKTLSDGTAIPAGALILDFWESEMRTLLARAYISDSWKSWANKDNIFSCWVCSNSSYSNRRLIQ